MKWTETGTFKKATLDELTLIDDLVYKRKLSATDMADLDKWIAGKYDNLTAEFMIEWLKGKPFREDLPSGVVFP